MDFSIFLLNQRLYGNISTLKNQHMEKCIQSRLYNLTYLLRQKEEKSKMKYF